MDGSLSFRVKGKKRQRKDYAHSLPVYSVNNVKEAMSLIQKVGCLGWIGGGPAWIFFGSQGTYEDLAKCTEACHLAYQELQGNKKIS